MPPSLETQRLYANCLLDMALVSANASSGPKDKRGNHPTETTQPQPVEPWGNSPELPVILLTKIKKRWGREESIGKIVGYVQSRAAFRLEDYFYFQVMDAKNGGFSVYKYARLTGAFSWCQGPHIDELDRYPSTR